MQRLLPVLLLSSCAAYSHAAIVIHSELPQSDRFGSATTSPNGPFAMQPESTAILIVGGQFGSEFGLHRSAMEFDLSTINGVVTHASLTFRVDVIGSPPAPYQIHGYEGDGSVSASDLLVNNLITLRNTNQPDAADVTSYVASLVAGGKPFAGFMFTSGLSQGPFLIMRSAEHPENEHPTLTITYTEVPEPMSALSVVGTAAIGMLRRRR